MPPNRQDLVVQRIVIKEGFSRHMVDILLEEICRALKRFASQLERKPKTRGYHFHH